MSILSGIFQPKRNALIKAVKRGSLKGSPSTADVQRLLGAGADINYVDDKVSEIVNIFLGVNS